MEAFISALLDNKVKEIIAECEKEFNIDNTYISLEDYVELHEKELELIMLIGGILRKQRGERV